MEKYIVIQEFMIKDLRLKGNELVVYALLYGFSQDGKTAFNGSLSYISQWIGTTQRTTINILNNLLKRKLIQKKQVVQNKITMNLYYCSMQRYKGGSEKISEGGSEKNSEGGSEKISEDIIYNNNNNNNKEKGDFKQEDKEKDLISRAEKNSFWKEQISMNLKIDFNSMWSNFLSEYLSAGVIHNTEQELQRHFYNWAKKKRQQPQQGTITGTLTKTDAKVW